jgi:1,4-dihydroxy-2-naphthoate octaprenyltransferase
MTSVIGWLKAMRIPFFTASVAPVILGTAAGYYVTGQVLWLRAILAAVGIMFLNAGTNFINDYYDYKSGNDQANRQFNPFSGGSRSIQNKVMSPRAVFISSIICFACAIPIGLYLNFITGGWVILSTGVFGMLAGYFYTASPVKLGYRSMGELLVGLCLGPLAVIAAYFLQTGSFSWPILVFASIPLGLLVNLILYINEFPDYLADKAVHKHTIIVLLGPKRARWGFYILMLTVFAIIVVGAVLGYLPLWSLIALAALPLSLRAIMVIHRNYERFPQMLPANVMTITTHLAVGLLLSLAYVLGRCL